MREQNQPIFETYAAALSDAAHNKNEDMNALKHEAESLRTIFRDNTNLLRLLERPAICKDEKLRFIRRIFANHLHPLMLNLGLLLVDKNRGGMWDGVMELFIELVEREQGIYSCLVESAHVLSDSERNQLQETLENYTQHTLHLTYRHEPSFLGGVRVRYGDLMIGNTISSELKDLRERLEAIRID